MWHSPDIFPAKFSRLFNVFFVARIYSLVSCLRVILWRCWCALLKIQKKSSLILLEYVVVVPLPVSAIFSIRLGLSCRSCWDCSSRYSKLMIWCLLCENHDGGYMRLVVTFNFVICQLLVKPSISLMCTAFTDCVAYAELLPELSTNIGITIITCWVFHSLE